MLCHTWTCQGVSYSNRSVHVLRSFLYEALIMCCNMKASAGEACLERSSQCSALQAKAGSAKKARRKAAKGKDAMVPHYEVLACEYHVSIVAGLSLVGAPAICSASQCITLS